MKNQLMYTIIGVFIFVIAISGATYAFFTSATRASNNVNTNSNKMNIEYSGGGSFDGPMKMVSSRDQGYTTTINMHTTNNSVSPNVTLYIYIENITNNIAIDGFTWEVCANRANDTERCNKGTFAGKSNDTNNNTIDIMTYALNTSPTEFKVYLWLDGSKISTDISGASFKGYIAAKSENFTAKFT